MKTVIHRVTPRDSAERSPWPALPVLGGLPAQRFSALMSAVPELC